MSTELIGFLVGAAFGAALFVGDLANPDKIVGTLRLKDFHAMRTIAVFVLVGMLGVWLLDLAGMANFSVKPTILPAVLIGAGLLGVGFGMTGYCPGTGLACAAAGRMDALVTAAGMLCGALVFILVYPQVVPPLESVGNYGKVMLPGVTGMSRAVWTLGLCAVGGGVLWFTRKAA